MIELDRHIEILLLNNDCVIVPNLGGFMTHHVEARYEEEEQVFLPPLRTLGFNPQLKINDSLLAQSYIEAYDISYPEAIQRIDDEVNELTQHLQSVGSYELNNIGILSLNDDGNYVFTPCEAGILTPSLYGLNTFEMKTIKAISVQGEVEEPAKNTVKETSNAVKIEHPMKHLMEDTVDEPIDITDDVAEDDDNDVVRIKFSWIRNAVAVAAILIAIFFVAMPTGKTELMTRTISNLNNQLLFGMMSSNDTNTSAIDFKRKDVERTGAKADAILDTIKPTKVTDNTQKSIVRKGYCIVLASYVTKHNAEDFISRLAKRGYEGAEIYVHNNVTRIVYGHFDTPSDAYNKLQKMSREKELEEAWVYKYNEKSE